MDSALSDIGTTRPISKPRGWDPYPNAMRLACAMLYVKDLPRMRDFYLQVLGQKPVNNQSMETWALFHTGGTRFALHAVPPSVSQNIEIASPPKARESNPMKLIFAVDDVLAERNRLQAMGVTMLQPEWQNADEACEAIDPEGNIFQLTSVSP